MGGEISTPSDGSVRDEVDILQKGGGGAPSFMVLSAIFCFVSVTALESTTVDRNGTESAAAEESEVILNEEQEEVDA